MLDQSGEVFGGGIRRAQVGNEGNPEAIGQRTLLLGRRWRKKRHLRRSNRSDHVSRDHGNSQPAENDPSRIPIQTAPAGRQPSQADEPFDALVTSFGVTPSQFQFVEKRKLRRPVAGLRNKNLGARHLIFGRQRSREFARWPVNLAAQSPDWRNVRTEDFDFGLRVAGESQSNAELGRPGHVIRPPHPRAHRRAPALQPGIAQSPSRT